MNSTTDVTHEQALEALYATGHWLLSQSRSKDAADVFRAMAQAKPEDERAWLGLGQAHESASHQVIAKEMYVTGVTLARGGRCAIALARLLREFGHDASAADAIDFAAQVADEREDESLGALVRFERGQS
jgi:hypothetical protein